MKVLIVLTIAALAAASLLYYTYNKDSSVNPQPVATLDLARYSGHWYEIARTAFFEKDFYCTTANYTLNSDDTVTVLNSCNVGSPDGRFKTVKGVATPLEPVNGTVTAGALKVKFGLLLGGPYYVLALDSDYQWALVGSNTAGQMWILSRTPTLDQDIYTQLVNQAAQEGYDTSKLIQTYQGANCTWSDE